MEASDKNRLSVSSTVRGLFESKVAAARKATAGGSVITEFPSATEICDHFQLCTASDVGAVIMGSSLKSYSLVPLPTVSGSSTTSPLTFEIDYIGWPFIRELSTKCVSWCTSVCIKPHQHTSLNLPVHNAHRCLNQKIVVTSVPLRVVTL